MWKPTLIFLALAFGLSGVFWIVFFLTGTPLTWTLFLMWMPALAAVLTCLILKRPLAFLGLGRWSTKYAFLGYLIPIVYTAGLYIVLWLADAGGFFNRAVVDSWSQSLGLGDLGEVLQVALFIVITGTSGMLVGLATATGEEIGWRGFLQPELYRHMNFATMGLVSGLIWAAWHFPITPIVYADADVPTWYWVTTFTIGATCLGIVAAYLRIVSGSLWPTAFLHGSANLWHQSVIFPLNEPNDASRWWMGDLGVGVTLVLIPCAIVAIVLSRRPSFPSSDEFERTNGIPRWLDGDLVSPVVSGGGRFQPQEKAESRAR
jgi:uncharacterized protein